ncbi:MAG: shikimate dehydrogenase family protein [Candidatus Bruticola sp.]
MSLAKSILLRETGCLEQQFSEQLASWEKYRSERRLLGLSSAWRTVVTERKSLLSIYFTLQRWQEICSLGEELRLSVLGGQPIAHSLSPALHNFFNLGTSAQTGLYLCAGCQNEDQFLEVLKNWFRLPLIGANVTSPFKECAFKYLEKYGKLTPEARAIGAVNTIYSRAGFLYGANTDWSGWLSSWCCDIGQSLAGRKVVLFGAGGAARAVVYALIRAGVGSIIIVNSPLRGRKLVDYFSKLQCQEGNKENLVDLRYCSSWEGYKVESGVIYIQATVLGSEAYPELSPYSWSSQRPKGELAPSLEAPDLREKTHLNSTVACDLVYVPERTKFLLGAEAAGAVTMNGLGMLICQACQAREHFLHIKHSDAWEEQMLSKFRQLWSAAT